MEPTKPHEAAFPITEESSNGLSKREFFAAMALQGMYASGYKYDGPSGAAFDAVKAADALIEKLNQKVLTQN